MSLTERGITMSNHGELIDRNTVRFERLLPGPIDRVWRYLIDGDKRAQWLCGGDAETKVGGRIDMLFNNARLSGDNDIEAPEKHRKYSGTVGFAGRVTRYEPPNVFAHTWEFEDEASEVLYELSEQGDRVLLVLTHSRLQSEETVLSVSAGWHTHLEFLAAVLEGSEPPPFWKTSAALESDYEKRLGLR